MKIVIDIGHPAHVHYFKNYIRIMKERGNEFLIIARDKEVTQTLLEKYNIPYINRGQGGSSFLSKMIYLLKTDLFIAKRAKKFGADLFLSFASVYAAHAAALCGKPHITLDDTEHAKLDLFLYPPFSKVIFTPISFKKDIGKKQIRLNFFMELASLHPNYFSPDPQVLHTLGVNEDENYAILRFISWNASHDAGQKGMSFESKKRLVDNLCKKMKVFISSESDLPQELKPFQIKISPEQIHDALSFASLYIGEGGTTATECGVMGVPNVLINPLAKTVGAHHILQDYYQIQYFFDDIDTAESTIYKIIDNPNIREQFEYNKKKLLAETVDITALLVWFTENYPKSLQLLKQDSNYFANHIEYSK